jgi:hypothetical protein
MFGHQDNQPADQSDQDNLAAASAAGQGHPDQQSTPPVPGPHMPGANPAFHHPGKAASDLNDQHDDVISPAGGFPQALSSKEPVVSPVPHVSNHPHLPPSQSDNQLTEATDEDLIEIKQQALEELFPLIDKLDQAPEERFKTLMMIIQASDNHALIQKAYQIAQTIDVDKERAQALLDIVNEINYFTQQPEV